jgi:hypothetical protein
LGAGVKVGPGIVIGVPAGAYVGRRLAGVVPLAKTIDGGGHARASTTVCGMAPAPAPPVCQEASGPAKGEVFPHWPTAALTRSVNARKARYLSLPLCGFNDYILNTCKCAEGAILYKISKRYEK